MTVLLVAITALFAAGAVQTYRMSGWTWVSVGLAASTILLGLGSIVESLVMRIEITDDALLVTDLRGHRRYAISDIERVEEAKGSPVAILLTTGRWVKLPSVGSNVGNSIRAWLRQRAGRSST
jgi:hypothetical protein